MNPPGESRDFKELDYNTRKKVRGGSVFGFLQETYKLRVSRAMMSSACFPLLIVLTDSVSF